MPKNKDLFVVILAGGSGTRFWPVSRKSKPKQFLNITGKNTLLQETIERIRTKVGSSNIYILTNKDYKRQVASQTSRFRIPNKNILLEPSAKNTAPSICWAAAVINKINPNAVMAVLPSDHLILKKNKFLSALGKAVQLAKKNYLVTFGIVPTRPETGYGYLKTKKQKVGGSTILRVEKFTEKPKLAIAKKFVKQKKYYWNSGMFIWKTSVILEEMKKYLPKVYNKFTSGTGQAAVNKKWSSLQSISIDYGILERTKRGAAVGAEDIGWSDLGSWESLAEVLSKDKAGNAFDGDILNIACRNTLVVGGKRLIAAVGLEDMVVVDTPDALLVCPKEKSQAVKDVVSALIKKKRSEFK